LIFFIRIITLISILSSFILFNISFARNQEKDDELYEKSIRFYFAFGGSALDIQDLNAELESKGYSPFSSTSLLFGTGIQGVLNRIIIDAEVHQIIANEDTTSTGNYKTAISTNYALLNFGYRILSKGNINVYPLVGLGHGSVRVKLIERTTPSFEDFLDDPLRNSTISTGGLIYNAALGADYSYKFKGKLEEKEKYVVSLGVRGGYTFSKIERDWSLEGVDISGGPEVRFTGPYIFLLFGLVGISN
jgi:hypothetical protein